ncbi:helix-turn-helix transcriptional regulator [Saccharopolyspora sp. NPDC047091]|uniref:helix-turn-helix domain-containing protein n=1 Tax=Saccharopolyspora sp. NPDC047091 TaxID=3155924 RepID=UPI0033FBDEB6
MARTSPTFRRRRLARTIKRLREQAGMTQDRAAIELDMSKSALSRKETGETAATVHEVRSMMDLYDGYDPDVLELARAAKQKGWWRAYGVEDRGYVDLETEASHVRELSLMYIPGLLQTEDYMRAIFAGDRLNRTKQELDDQVAVRIIRQEQLIDPERPLKLTAVVDEAAFRRPMVERRVLREQLMCVLEATRSENIDLRVLAASAGPHIGLDGAFTLLEFPDLADRDMLYIAHPAGSIHVEKDGEVRRARLVFEQLWAHALSADATVDLIDRVVREL